MSRRFCFANKSQNNYNPPEVENLLKNTKFRDMPQEDIIEFYNRFKNVTGGEPFLNKNQFIEILGSFNLFPNNKVADRMFDIVDKDTSNNINFIEFMKYIFMMVDGTKEEKSSFIFKMIAFKEKSTFNLQDLTHFYAIVNAEDEISGLKKASSQGESDLANEMAKGVFDILKVDYRLEVNKDKFINFIFSEEYGVDLFNFLNGDMESPTKGIRTKWSYMQMIHMLKHLQEEINKVEGTGNEYESEDYNQNPVKSTKLSLFLQNILKSRLPQEPILTQKELNVNGVLEKAPVHIYNVRSNRLNLVPEVYNDECHMNGKIALEELDTHESRRHTTDQFTPNKLPGSNKNIEAIICMKIVTDKLINILDKEIETVDKEERLSFNLRHAFSQNNQEMDQKKRVFINNPNWNIVTTMISGIHKSLYIGLIDKYHVLNKNDFKFHNEIQLQAIYTTQFDKCKFKDYAPYVFQSIRRQYGISYDSYIKSIGVNTFRNAFFDRLYLMLAENSTGKSGSFFFQTSDNRFTLKTIKREEFRLLKKTLPQYHDYILKNPATLITRYFGLHQIKCYNGKLLIFDVYILVMNNVLNLSYPERLEEKYDLKGSSYKRLTHDSNVKRNHAKKDLNFIDDKTKIAVNSELRDVIINQMQSDAEFLSHLHIIDYSLLVGIISKSNDTTENYFSDRQNTLEEYSNEKNGTNKKSTYIESIDGEMHYYIGIIDTLTHFGGKKRGEFITKRIFQGKGISCVPPEDYKHRFVTFMKKAIISNQTE